MRKFLLTALLVFCKPAFSALTIEIVGGGATQIPISVPAFDNDKAGVSSVISSDLARSGVFKLIEGTSKSATDVYYPDWKAKGADALVLGSIVSTADGKFEAKFRLFDILKQTQIAGMSLPFDQSQTRQAAHKIADIIYEKLTGDVGVFSTKIAYVLKQGKHYELQVADSDGYGAQAVVSLNEPIISPAWSPDGRRLAYVSFEHKKAVVYVQDVFTGKRHVLANFQGSNSSPFWSPDGRQLAVVLSRDGNSQIYLVSVDGSGLRRLETSYGIDTEPRFSPDGQWLIFTSDRGGAPQVYRLPVAGGKAERLTFEGSYNVSPNFSPDGKSFCFIQRNGGKFNVAVEDFATRQVQVLTEGELDESPSFAPNGKLILYAAEFGGRGILAIVSSDGRIKQRLSMQSGDVREPVWGPLTR